MGRIYVEVEQEIEGNRYKTIEQLRQTISKIANQEVNIRLKHTTSMLGDYRLHTEFDDEEYEIDYIRDNENRFYITAIY